MSARVIAAAFRLVRWANAAIAAGGVAAGAWWAAGRLDSRVALAAASGAALAAFANSYNDVADREIDAIAHPDRPLPAGQLTVGVARSIALASATLGWLLARAASPALGAPTIAILIAMAFYSGVLKRHGLAGNALVAVLASVPFLYGSWAVGRPLAAVPLLVLAMPLHFAREVAKDIDDVSGDRVHRRTLPISGGAAAARSTVAASVALFVGLAVGAGLRQPGFLVACAPTILLSVAAVWRVSAGRRGGPLFLKAAMVCALGAILIAAPRA